jgi:nitrogen fixation NifU-like protein
LRGELKLDRQLIIENLQDHYENPRNYGALENADVVQEGGNPGCGDIVTIYLKVNGDDTIERVNFEGEGCTISQAAASIVTEMVKGKTLAEIEAMDYNDLLDLLGREVVMTRVRCATLGLGTLKGATKQYITHKMLTEAGVE